MYPLPDDYFAPKHLWYLAGWSSQIGREPTERWILDEPVALYRKEDGTAVALEGPMMLAGARKTVIPKDGAATEAVEAMITDLDGRPFKLLLKADRACVLGRRIFEQMIAAERGHAAVAHKLIAEAA